MLAVAIVASIAAVLSALWARQSVAAARSGVEEARRSADASERSAAVAEEALEEARRSGKAAELSAAAASRSAQADEHLAAIELERRTEERALREAETHASLIANLELYVFDAGSGKQFRVTNHGPSTALEVAIEIVATDNGDPPPLRGALTISALPAGRSKAWDLPSGIRAEPVRRVECKVRWQDGRGVQDERRGVDWT